MAVVKLTGRPDVHSRTKDCGVRGRVELLKVTWVVVWPPETKRNCADASEENSRISANSGIT